MRDAFFTVLFVAVLAALVWLGWRYEPHWVSRDGLRFTCRVRPLHTDRHRYAEAQRQAADRESLSMANLLGAGGRRNAAGSTATTWREARGFIDRESATVQLIARVGMVRRPLAPARLIARGDTPLHRRWIYVIETEPTRELRVPVGSRAVPLLDELVERTSGTRPPTPG